MITPKFELPHQSTIKEGMKLLVTGVPSLNAFNGKEHMKSTWEKSILGRIVKVVDIQHYKEGLVGVCLVSAKVTSTNYVHEGCLLDIGIRD